MNRLAIRFCCWLSLCVLLHDVWAKFAAADDVNVKVSVSGKMRSYPVRTVGDLKDFQCDPAAQTMTRYGGWQNRRVEAKGYFYTKIVDGRWFLIDPDGHLFLSVGVNTVTPPKILGDRPDGHKPWVDASHDLLREHGINTLGMWSDIHAFREASVRLPYVTTLRMAKSFYRTLEAPPTGRESAGIQPGVLPLFHPEFEAHCRRCAADLTRTKDDPFLIGHFSDNELPLPCELLQQTLSIDADMFPSWRHDREAAWSWFRNRRGKEAAIESITDEDQDAWRGHVMDRYYRITTEAIRTVDPNHLCLGSRLHSDLLRTRPVIRAAGRYLDIVSFNYYGRWTPDPARTQMWLEEAGKPFLISEFYVKAEDSQLRNTQGTGWIVPTQADRGDFYQNFVLGLLESRGCVGWHWHKFADDNGPKRDRSANKGIVNIDQAPYRQLLEPMRGLNRVVYPLALRK